MPKNGDMVRSDCLTSTMQKLQLNRNELAKAIGKSPSTISKALDIGMVPKTTSLACEALVRRQGKFGAVKYSVIVVPAERADEIRTIITALGGKVADLDIS